MSKSTVLAALAALTLVTQAPHADACGGFFCGRLPVDQTAERILFEVGEDSVTMTTQITFNGDARDFAWILPLPEVPDADSLSVFPQLALTGLDSNSGPVFIQPDDPECYPAIGFGGGGVVTAAAPEAAQDDSEVTVFIEAEVGDYQVAVVESEDPTALIEWLRGEDYRVTGPMEPYIELYTGEAMKFLALKLLDTADVKNLKPFRFTLPGTAPSIPLRMTSLAAEPEMSIVVFVLGQARYEGKNWENVSISDDQIKFNPFSYTFPVQTNWTKLVAEAVNEAGGTGWVTEFAGSTGPYLEQVRAQVESGNFASPEQEEAAGALVDVLEAHPYLTRLYSRLSAEEMTSDPILGQSSEGDVEREHQLQRIVDGIDQCLAENMMEPSVDPCDFATCGAGGLCRPVAIEDSAGTTTELAGCACVPGATARTTFAPDGSGTVICQDQRMSFLNPGDQEIPEVQVLGDPCAGFDCGANGSCLPMNMTPTCVCNEGFVAFGSFGADGQRTTTCVEPLEPVPADFYEERLPDLPELLPGGREVDVPEPAVDPTTDEPEPNMGDSEPTAAEPDPSTGEPDPSTGEPDSSTGEPMASDPTTSEPTAEPGSDEDRSGDPVAAGNEPATGDPTTSTQGSDPNAVEEASSDGGCACSVGSRPVRAPLLLGLGLGMFFAARRRRRQAH